MVPGPATKLANRIINDSQEREAFLRCLEAKTAADPAVVWTRGLPQDLAIAERDLMPIQPIQGQPPFVWKLAPGVRAGKSRWHEAGQLYCLDYSSVLEMFPLSVVKDVFEKECRQTLDLVDVCAAPGGKSVLAHLWISPKAHVANEIDPTRAFTLRKNLERVGLATIQITNTAVENLSAQYLADVLLIDAPCSGQSLIARGESNPGAFHPSTINGNANRQRRILAEACTMARPGAFIVYSTCTYSFEENEKVIRWFLKQFPNFSSVEVPHLARQRSDLLEDFCYRFFPHRGDGAGGFTCLLRRQSV